MKRYSSIVASLFIVSCGSNSSSPSPQITKEPVPAMFRQPGCEMRTLLKGTTLDAEEISAMGRICVAGEVDFSLQPIPLDPSWCNTYMATNEPNATLVEYHQDRCPMNYISTCHKIGGGKQNMILFYPPINHEVNHVWCRKNRGIYSRDRS